MNKSKNGKQYVDEPNYAEKSLFESSKFYLIIAHTYGAMLI